MELKQLEHLLAVCSAGSFSSAAKRLGISQPTLGKSIARLEKTLRIELFDRKGGRATPTIHLWPATLKRQAFRAPPPATLDGLRIGILENGKLNADEMLREVAALFVERHGCTVRTVASKKNASAPALAATLVSLAQDVDFLVTGLGD